MCLLLKIHLTVYCLYVLDELAVQSMTLEYQNNQGKKNFPSASLPRPMQWEATGHMPRMGQDYGLNTVIQDTSVSLDTCVPPTLMIWKRKEKITLKRKKAISPEARV